MAPRVSFDAVAENGKSSTSPLLAVADWTDFRSLETLPRKGGVSLAKLPALIVKEVVDNALDAAGNTSVERIGPNGFRVVDGGPGIGLDDVEVATLFSFGRPRVSSKLWRRPDRGALGNGLRVVAGAAAATGGTITVSTRGRTLRLTPQLDGTTHHEVLGEYRGEGTVVEVQLGRDLPLDECSLDWAREAIGWAGQGVPYKGKSSPHWFSESAFFELCQAQGPEATVHRFIQQFDGCSETVGVIASNFAKGQLVRDLTREGVANLLWHARNQAAPVRSLKQEKRSVSWGLRTKQPDRAVLGHPGDALERVAAGLDRGGGGVRRVDDLEGEAPGGPCGGDGLPQGSEAEIEGDEGVGVGGRPPGRPGEMVRGDPRKGAGRLGFFKPLTSQRLGSLGKPDKPWPYERLETHLVVGGAQVPAVVEIYGMPARRMSAKVLVNRTPVVGEMYAGMDKDGQQLEVCLQGGGLNFGLPVTRTQPACSLTISVLAPAVPLTSDGKSPDLGSIEDGIMEAVAKVVKKVKRLTPATAGHADQVAVIFATIQEAAAKASGGWKARFSIRQLYYNVRPFVLLRCGKELAYGYFCKVVTRYENSRGKIPLLYRDPRGVLIHPHTGESISLGTLAVETYERPRWVFNKVLYVEKKGFFPALEEAKFGERNDCALMSSDGYATGAVRDLLDLLDGHDEEVTIFCIHDADAYGTMIYQSLQDETASRPGRKFKVINLGLEPGEAIAMAEAGLVEVERTRKKENNRKPVAGYVPADEAEWLQSNRVELNAMSTPQFLEWLEAKFAPYAGKVIPPTEVLSGQLREDVEAQLREDLIARILRENDLDGQVARGFREREGAIRAAVSTIGSDVRDHLESEPTDLWKAPVRAAAKAIVSTS